MCTPVTDSSRIVSRITSRCCLASDGTQEVDLVNPDGVEPAYRLLVEVTERLAIAHSPSEEVTPTEYYALVRQILNRAGDLDQESRSIIRRAFREAGYGFAAPACS